MSVQQFNKNHQFTQPVHIYYDMNLINNDASFPGDPVRFQYKETRSNDFLSSPQNYFMSIVRFNLQSPTLPVFIPQINLNPNTNNGSIYPIIALSANLSAQVEVLLIGNYLGVIPVDAVIYLSYNALNPSVAPPGDTSGTGLQYCRISDVRLSVLGSSPNSQLVTRITLAYLNGTTITGTPANYPAGVAAAAPILRPWKGATQNLNMAIFNINALTVLTSNSISIDCNTAILGTLPASPMKLMFKIGDIVYIQNTNGYNGVYTVKDVFPNTLVLTIERTINAPPYAGGGQFKSIGDYQNLTPYNMTMSWIPIPLAGQPSSVYQVTMPVVYRPADLSLRKPLWDPYLPQAIPLGGLTSPYYYVYSYGNWVDMLNSAVQNCFNALQGYATNGDAVLTAPNQNISSSAKQTGVVDGTTINLFQPPSISWDENSLKYIITADNQGFNAGLIDPILFYLNSPLSTLMDSFPYNYPNVPITSPLYSQLIFDFGYNAGAYIVATYDYLGTIPANSQYLGIQIYQNHQTASLLNPIQSIVFTSTLLPVVMENVGTPLIINGTSTQEISLGSTANIFPIVTDFVVPFSATNGYVPDITYVPTGEYRLVDMYGTSPCKQIDIQVFWKDLYGILHPFLVGSGCSGSLKVMFRRKDFANVEL